MDIERRRFERRHIGREGKAPANPRPHSTVQHSHAIMSKPAQHPPQPYRVHAAIVVIDDHLRLFSDPGFPEFFCQNFGIGHRMAAVVTVHRCGQVPVQMHEKRAWNMSLGIGLLTVRGICQAMAAIEDSPRRICQMSGERLTRNDGRECHADTSRRSSQASASLSSSKTFISALTKICDNHALHATH